MATYRVPVLDDFSWQPPVSDKDLTAPPGGESKGDRYIVASAATGAWEGLEDHIVTYDGSDWIDATPLEGWYVYVTDENILYHYTGAAWDADDISSLEGDITSIDTRISNVESSVGSIDTAVTNVESSVGSIDTVASTNTVNISTNTAGISTNVVNIDNVESSVGSIDTVVSTNVVNISTNVVAIDNVESSVGSIDTHVDSCDSSIVSINTRATNIESSVGSINTAKQDKGTYVSEYGCIEFTI